MNNPVYLYIYIYIYIRDDKITDLRETKIRLSRIWHETSGLFAGNNHINVEVAHTFLEMEQLLKASMRN